MKDHRTTDMAFLPLAPGHMAETDSQNTRLHWLSIERWANAIMGMIADDEAEGLLRGHTIRCFDDLDGLVDRSQYDMDAGVPWGTDAEALGVDPYEFVNAVQNRVDEMLHSRKANQDYHLIEATCATCGETYNPANPTDEHIQREDGAECGGAPTNVGLIG